jgi:type IV pilus assembly protein PilB
VSDTPLTAEDGAVRAPGWHVHKERSALPIGEIVAQLGFADRATIEAAVHTARADGRTTGRVLVDQRAVTEEQLARALSMRIGVDYVDLAVFEPDAAVVGLVSADTARRYQAVPVARLDDGSLLLAMADPTNVLILDDVAMLTGERVRPAAATADDIHGLLARLGSMRPMASSSAAAPVPIQIDLAATLGGEEGAIALVDSVVVQAIDHRASDIHFDPHGEELRVQLRIDGMLRPAARIPARLAASVVSRIKILGDLDISERRLAQEGRCVQGVGGRTVDLRILSLPVVEGEAVIIRVLPISTGGRSLESLGMLGPQRECFRQAIDQLHGAVLIAGPTGSGKTTTLYAALEQINTGARSIVTIEDPVETRIPGVKQVQVSPRTGVTFAGGFRSLLRADPDVIVVGEIRDKEAATTTMQAALSGHLVLGTVHTRGAPSTLRRLADLGVEEPTIAAAVDFIVAQRLVRTLCASCKRATGMPERPCEAVGCVRCDGTGFHGRVALYEVLGLTEEVRALVRGHASSEEITACAIEQGMSTVREDGLTKVRAGMTTLGEVERAARLRA